MLRSAAQRKHKKKILLYLMRLSTTLAIFHLGLSVSLSAQILSPSFLLSSEELEVIVAQGDGLIKAAAKPASEDFSLLYKSCYARPTSQGKMY